MSTTIADLRKEYSSESLLETDVAHDPVAQFAKWWQEAINSQIEEVNAMTLATASCDGLPSARIVLLKGFNEKGFVFFTNYKSYKAMQLEENPKACLVFFWKELERQVRIVGLVKRVENDENDAYFNSRPKNSRIGALASPQSQVIESREWIDEGHQSGDDAIKVLTADGLEVTIDLTVLYRVIPTEAPRLVRETGINYEDKIVRPISRTRIRDNAVYYEAVALYSTKRDEFQTRIFKVIETDFTKRGLFLENLLVRNITLPAAVKGSIEQKIQAEQDAQKMQFVLQKERQEADRKRVEAQGIADYQRIISESLTDRQLQYEQIKATMELAKSQNAKIIMTGGRNTPVILDAK